MACYPGGDFGGGIDLDGGGACDLQYPKDCDHPADRAVRHTPRSRCRERAAVPHRGGGDPGGLPLRHPRRNGWRVPVRQRDFGRGAEPVVPGDVSRGRYGTASGSDRRKQRRQMGVSSRERVDHAAVCVSGGGTGSAFCGESRSCDGDAQDGIRRGRGRQNRPRAAQEQCAQAQKHTGV